MTYTKTKPWGKSPAQLKGEKNHKRNVQTFKNPAFVKACEEAGITPTMRQASKFSRRLGLAYKHRVR